MPAPSNSFIKISLIAEPFEGLRTALNQTKEMRIYVLIALCVRTYASLLHLVFILTLLRFSILKPIFVIFKPYFNWLKASIASMLQKKKKNSSLVLMLWGCFFVTILIYSLATKLIFFFFLQSKLKNLQLIIDVDYKLWCNTSSLVFSSTLIILIL